MRHVRQDESKYSHEVTESGMWAILPVPKACINKHCAGYPIGHHYYREEKGGGLHMGAHWFQKIVGKLGAVSLKFLNIFLVGKEVSMTMTNGLIWNK